MKQASSMDREIKKSRFQYVDSDRISGSTSCLERDIEETRDISLDSDKNLIASMEGFMIYK
jgi:hypothetical protein